MNAERAGPAHGKGILCYSAQCRNGNCTSQQVRFQMTGLFEWPPSKLGQTVLGVGQYKLGHNPVHVVWIPTRNVICCMQIKGQEQGTWSHSCICVWFQGTHHSTSSVTDGWNSSLVSQVSRRWRSWLGQRNTLLFGSVRKWKLRKTANQVSEERALCMVSVGSRRVQIRPRS